jgi:hypothetical protein
MVRNHNYEQAKSLFMNTIERVKRTGETTLPLAWYNFACVAAAANDRAAAVEHLRDAINLGLTNTAHMRTDPDLKSLHRDPRFEALLRSTQKPTLDAAPTAVAER